MPNRSARLPDLKRPKLLVRAARLAAENIQRKPVLKRIFGDEDIPKNTVSNLAEIETELNEKRKTGDAEYSIACHVTVLAALMHEAALWPT